jgi:multiple sugar transport system permease protein
LSDRAIAWLFITPTMLLLLAINIFPLDLDDPAVVHQLQRANMPNAAARFIGLDNYIDILTDEDVWAAMQVDRAFRGLDDRAGRCCSASAWRC